MNTRRSATSNSTHAAARLFAAAAILAVALIPAAWARSGAALPAPAPQAAQQKTFATPEEARDALVAAGTAKDRAALAAIFGPEYDKLRSPDPVQETRHSERFAAHLQEAAALEKVDDGRYTVFIGTRRFPFPIPIVKDGDKWRFDTHAGIEEILNRRVGENELSAIMTCRAYVLAQWEYFTQSGNHNEDGLAEYAERFISSPGKRDGLYWETTPDEDPSPLGLLVAMARAEGYGPAANSTSGAHVQPAKQGISDAAKPAQAETPHAPFHGYYFKILLRQGASAPGRAFSYLINTHMIAGFALVAYPAQWGNSGVMTFIVNTQGRVYQKNLGAKTADLALAMREYNPDPSWSLVPKNN
jgi:hypothetical protein